MSSPRERANATRVAATLIVGTAALALLGRTLPEPTVGTPATASVPAGAKLLVTVDARALRRTSLGDFLRPDAAGTLDLAKLCGADPTATITELALAVPDTGDGELGIVATGPFVAQTLARCASRVVESRKGRPITLREGAFLVVTDVASTSVGTFAVRDGGPLLLGGATYVRQMMAVTSGAAPSIAVDARHVALRAEAGERRTVVASALVAEGTRAELARSLGDARSGVLSVLGVAAAADVVGSRVELHAVAGCATEAACASVASGLRALKQPDEDVAPLLRATGLAAILQRAEISSTGPVARLRVTLDTTEARDLVSRALVSR